MAPSERSCVVQAAIVVLAVAVLLCLSLAAVTDMPHMAGAAILCCFTLVALVTRAIVRQPIVLALPAPPDGWTGRRSLLLPRWAAPRAPDPAELGVLLI